MYYVSCDQQLGKKYISTVQIYPIPTINKLFLTNAPGTRGIICQHEHNEEYL